MKLLKILVNTIVIVSSVFSSQLPSLTTDKYTIDFNGASGGFKLISNSDNTFYNMRYGWLTETPANKLNLDFNTFDYGSNDNKTYVNTELTDGSFQLQIKNELWKVDNEYINEANQTVIVDKDVMKMTILMSGWNFINFNNDLTLDFTISNNIGHAVSNIDNSTIRLREFDFSFEKTAIVDGQEKQIDFYTLGNKYYLVFPSFTTDLFYDPSIMYLENNENNSSQLKPILYLLLTSLSTYLMM